MKNRVPIDLLAILFLYAIYFAVIYIVRDLNSPDLLASLYIRYFHSYSYIVLGVSLTCTLLWYVLGEWGLKPWSPESTWYIAWFALLAVVVVAEVAVFFKTDRLIQMLAAPYYFLGGVLCFYLASVFFSPLNAMYLIWPAKHVRG